ncbi:MAG: hypothetical protein AYK19_03705 [Theionarchaea archaeon DG-70-1]|nr:MAG: hypothetical protein AYK19_03705 [Theionarchaea archaeon DG-70-1]
MRIPKYDVRSMKITKVEKIGHYHSIYHVVRKDALASIQKITTETGKSRNTVLKYLKDMEKRQILVGPRLELKPSVTHPRYMYFASFSSPEETFNAFKGFPSILYHFRCLGDWNFLFVTDRVIDFSQLRGHSETLYFGKRGFIWDAPAQLTTADKTISTINNWLDNPQKAEIPQGEPIEIPWTQDEWKLYWKFKDCVRVKVTPTIKEIKVRYEAFVKWKRSFNQYTQTLVEFYPRGFPFYTMVFFLFETDQPEYVVSAFQYWPATTIFQQVGDRLLLLLATPRRELLSKSLDLSDYLRTHGFASSYTYALLLQQWNCDFIPP